MANGKEGIEGDVKGLRRRKNKENKGGRGEGKINKKERRGWGRNKEKGMKNEKK